jgi:MFS family permease
MLVPYFIYIVIIVGFLDNFTQLPIISPYAKALGGSSFWIGLVVSLYSLSNMLGNVIAGRWIDSRGSKRIMIVGLAVAGCSLVLYPLAGSVQQLAVIRFLHGLGGGLLVPAAFAFLSDRLKERGRGQAMAWSGAAIGIAAIVGPAYGGIFSQRLSVDWVFLSIAVLLFITALLVAFVLPEPGLAIKHREKEKGADLFKFLGKANLLPAYLGALALMFGVGILTYALPLKVETLGFGSSLTGLLMSVYGLVAILLFLLPTNRLSDRVGRMIPMICGLMLLAVGLFLLSVFRTTVSLVLSMVVFGAGFALLFPAMTALVVDKTQSNERGQAFGLFYAFFSLGVVAGPLLAGGLAATFDQSFAMGAVALLGTGAAILLMNWGRVFKRNLM